MIDIEIDGLPIPWKRPGHRSIRSGDKNIAIIYDRQKKEKEMIQWQLRSQYKNEPVLCPLLLDVVFRFPVPKAASAKLRTQMLNGMVHHYHKPDCDNLVGFYQDCMNGIVYKDDAQICDLHVRKIYALYPSTLIRIRPFEFNINKEEIETIEDLYKDENNLRDTGQRELSGNRPNEERIIPIGGGGADNQPV
jgi:Holliday junction resolvase RusA-like endonuclease